jgi:anti-sigma factor RsiW
MGAMPVLSDHLEHRRTSRRIGCEDVAAALPAIVDGNNRADRRIQQHVGSCLRCQAELVQYRKLLRALRQLRTEYLEPAPGLLSGILAGLEEAGERGAIRSLVSGRRAAYIGGVAAAATAAGAAGTIVLVQRAAARRKGMRLAG